MSKLQICIRVDKDILDILNYLEENYGLSKSAVVRLALTWFAPTFAVVLERIKFEMQLGLEKEVEQVLKKAVERARGRALNNLHT